MDVDGLAWVRPELASTRVNMPAAALPDPQKEARHEMPEWKSSGK